MTVAASCGRCGSAASGSPEVKPGPAGGSVRARDRWRCGLRRLDRGVRARRLVGLGGLPYVGGRGRRGLCRGGRRGGGSHRRSGLRGRRWRRLGGRGLHGRPVGGARADVLPLVLLFLDGPDRGIGGHLGRERGLGAAPLGLALRADGLGAAGVQLRRQVAQRHVDRQRELGLGLVTRTRQAALLVDQFDVAQQVEVPLALDLERVVVVPARPAEVAQRASEVQDRDPRGRRHRGQQAQPDGQAVVDAVRHVLLEQLAAQPVGLRARDGEHVRLVAGAHVALADLGQLDRPAVLLDEPGGPREGDELPCPPEGVLESGREQVLDRELGHELVEPDALALADRAQ